MAAELPLTDRYRELFLQDVPLLDVRAPVEFAAGAFPGAVNRPLIDDAERHQIGLEYAEQGPDAATALGHELVSGALRRQRIQAWVDFAHAHPNGALYCFRGGQRSGISQQWLYEASGIAYPRIIGGYKALRRFLIDEIERIVAKLEPLVISGKTGAGKTRLLTGMPNFIDLERLAWHRGSAFGRHATPQPSQIDFENALAIALIKQEAAGGRLLLEDESQNIGSLWLPKSLVESMRRAPCVLLEVDLDTRVSISLQEYVVDALHEHQTLLGIEAGFQAWAKALRASLERIRKRLGGALHASLSKSLDEALLEQQRSGDTGLHRGWIEGLLTHYYDRMYAYQISKKQERICYRGDPLSVQNYLLAQR